MKPWAELTAGARGMRVGGVVAVIAAILWGVSSLRGGPHRGGPEGEGKPQVVAEGDAPKAEAPKEEPKAEEPKAVEPKAEAPKEEPKAEPAKDSATAEAAPAADAPAEAATEAATETAPADTAAAAPALPPAPKLDLVRIEKDGSAIVAGAGVAGATLSLRVNGVEVIAVPADGAGNFVGMFSLPPSDAPRQLAVVMVLPDGTEIPAEGTIAIAPTVAPQVAQVVEPATTETAEAAPAAEPATEPAALMVTDAGAKVLQGIGDGTVAAANVTVDAISYTPEGAVVLAGRGTAGASVRLYLDNAAAGEAVVGAGGDWSLTKSDIAPGVYTLRVDQVDASGKVTSRFESPFKRESLEALAAATAPAAEPAKTEAAPAETASAAPAPAATDTATTDTSAATTAAAPATASTEAATTATTEATTTEAATSTAPASETTTTAEASAPAATETAAVEPAPAATEVVASDATATATTTETAAAPATTETQVAAAEPAADPAPIRITVQPGFTLWRIARENLGDGVMYVQVFEANKDQIRNPDLIYPGQVFTIPKGN